MGRLTIIVTAYLAVRLLASFFPALRIWGFNQAAYVDYMMLLYPVLVAAAIYIYYRRNTLTGKGNSEAIENTPANLPKSYFAGGLVVICGLLFYLLHVKSYFLGDGLTIIANPEMSIKYREYGEAIIHKWLISKLGSSTDSALSAYQILSIASGVLFSAALVFYSKKITTTQFNYWLFILLILLSANTILFFGYVENYSITLAVISILILSAIASLKNKKGSIIPVAAFAIAVFLHTISLVYLPAFLFYVGLTFGGGKIRRLITRKSGAIFSIMILLLVIGYVVVRSWAPLFWRMAFLPPLGDQFTIDNYFLLSPRHLIDYVNLLFFLIPVTMVILILRIISRQKTVFMGNKPDYLFLGAASLFGLMAAFILEPKLGMARDWDLMSIMLIGAGVFGIYLWVDRGGEQKYFKPASFILTVLCVSIFVPWLVLHNSTDGLRRYSTSVMKLDPRHSRPGLQTMGAYLEKHGEISEAQSMAWYCGNNFPEIQINREGGSFFRLGQYSMAESKLKLALKENPSWAGLYLDLGICQLKLGRYAEALETLKIADGLNPYNAYTYNYLGEAYIQKGDTSRALNYWHKSIRGDVTVLEAYMSLGLYHLMARRADSAEYYLSQIPDEKVTINIYYWKGLAAFMLNDNVASLEYFNKYLSLGSDSSKIKNINRVKKQIENSDPGFDQ